MSADKPHSEQPPPQASMVGWYDPSQLARTGAQTVLSALFGERADFRAMQALSHTRVAHDLSDGNELWLDYVADTGDGFASTYAVAEALARETLSVTYLDNNAEVKRELPRGRVFVMGGDEVYPTPTQQGYQERLVGPYASALPYVADAAQAPSLFAIPGNHDWYDGLGSFMGLFCTRQHIGNWRTSQERSYFVLKLPCRVWLLGVDLQLGHDIDRAQYEDILKALNLVPGDRVILCTPEPDWSFRASGSAEAIPVVLDALRKHIEEEMKATIVLQLAGDLHHYRRQRDTGNKRHLITAGGGGAFLHPTHTNLPGPYKTLRDTYTCADKSDYPSRDVSRQIAWDTISFAYMNPWLGAVTAFLYVILGLVMPPIPDMQGRWYAWTLYLALDGVATVISDRPSSIAWVLLVIAGFFAFTDTHVRWYRYVAGFGHGAAHLTCALVGSIVASMAKHAVYTAHTNNVFEAGGGLWVPLGKALSLLAYMGTLALWGYLAGAMVFALYLLISVRLFGRHSNEAFSAIRHEGHRNFLRLHITENLIEVFAMGIDKVAPASQYKWIDQRWQLQGSAPSKPHVIEYFVAEAVKKT
jgi:hypothetical protein